MKTQLTKGLQRRLMYIENKDGTILGSDARIGWVTFSKTGRTVNYAESASVVIDEDAREAYAEWRA